jgi:GH24 family phage-related lysozyme (muramidase)
MYVSSPTLRVELLRIFAGAGARARDGLGFTEIARLWARTGLRDSDLRAAIHELMEGGELLSQQRDGALSFALRLGAGLDLAEPTLEPALQRAAAETETSAFRRWQQAGLLADAALRYRREDSLE